MNVVYRLLTVFPVVKDYPVAVFFQTELGRGL
jgi:hypothetical protein